MARKYKVNGSLLLDVEISGKAKRKTSVFVRDAIDNKEAFFTFDEDSAIECVWSRGCNSVSIETLAHAAAKA